MKSFLFLFLFNSAIFFSVQGQVPPSIQWQNTIGGSMGENLYSIQQTSDGGYFLAGTSGSGISGDKTDSLRGGLGDYWVLKIDASGFIQWQKTFGGVGFDALYFADQTFDGGYIIGGNSYSDISGEKSDSSRGGSDYWILKIDSVGNIQWQKTFGGFGSDVLYTAEQTLDGGYILGGTSGSDISGEKSENSRGIFDFWIIKTDSIGNIQWQKTIGGNDMDNLYSLSQTSDLGYILAGSSLSNISGEKSENCRGTLDFWIVKTNSLGIIQWQKTLGGTSSEIPNSVVQTIDGGFIIGGDSYSNISGDKTENSRGEDDFWLIKLDSVGSLVWQKTIGGNLSEWITSVIQTIDGGYLAGGPSASGISGEKTDFCRGIDDYWVVKLDTTGMIQWQKTLGGADYDELISLKATNDGGFILGGYSGSNAQFEKSENSQGQFDYWVIKLDSPVGISENNIASEMIIFPNPAKDELTITLSQFQNGQLEVYNSIGEKVYTQKISANNKLQIGNWCEGIYFVKITSGEKIVTEKFLVSH